MQAKPTLAILRATSVKGGDRQKRRSNGGIGVDPKVEFLFDFGSPNAYLAGKVVPQVEQRTGVKFGYVPVLLGGIFKLTGNGSPADSLKGIKNKPGFMALETKRFIRRYNIATFKPNPFFPVVTLMLVRGAVAAQFEGVFEPYVRAAFHHMWLDADRLMARAHDQDVKNCLRQLTQNAVDRGAFDCPTFFVAIEMFFGKDQLRDVEEEIKAQQAAGI
jgi:2-hydroxychromene-2-carboxylate isomerase